MNKGEHDGLSYVNSIPPRKTAIYTSTSMWNMMINSMAVKLMDHPTVARQKSTDHPIQPFFWQKQEGIRIWIPLAFAI